MAISAILMLTLYKTLSAGLKARETAEMTIAPVRAATLAADLIGKDLESVMPPPGTLAGAFTGTHTGAAGSASDGSAWIYRP